MTETTKNEDEEFEKMCAERQREVDHLSLELLSNTKHYKKFISKNTPEDQLKRIEYSRRFSKYKSRITALFIELMDEYENDLSDSEYIERDLHSIFKEFVQKMTQHLEWKEYSGNSDSQNEFDEDDMMFSHAGFGRLKQKKRQVADFSCVENVVLNNSTEKNAYSYWGATIRKSASSDEAL